MQLKCLDKDLELRPLIDGDAEALVALADGYHSEPQVNEWLFPEWTLEGSREFIRDGLERLAQGRGFWAGIWQSGRLAGVIGLELKSGSTASIDYMLAPAFRGKGLMTRACRAVIGHAFEELKVHRIEIMPDAKNIKSCGVPERLGFVKEGVLREVVSYGDVWGDLVVYGMLAGEWEGA